MEYEKHDCGGEIVDCEPSYIPLGKDSVMQIIDQKCNKCGVLIIKDGTRRLIYYDGKRQRGLVDEMYFNKARRNPLRAWRLN